jgi:hypothetical protein
MRDRLEAAMDLISGKGVDAEQRAQLARLRERLRNADTDAALNSVRSQLVTDFNGYAEGRMLFGPQMGPTEATAGVYRVMLTVDGVTHQGSLTVRDDPLKAERW